MVGLIFFSVKIKKMRFQGLGRSRTCIYRYLYINITKFIQIIQAATMILIINVSLQ